MPKIICAEKDCTIAASFNWPFNTTPLFCATHKKPDMANMVNRRCLLGSNCKNRPTHVLAKSPAARIACEQHKLPDMFQPPRIIRPRTKKAVRQASPPTRASDAAEAVEAVDDYSMPNLARVNNGRPGEFTLVLAESLAGSQTGPYGALVNLDTDRVQ